MGEADRDHVAIHRDRGVMYWALIVPSRVETCEEQAAEMVARCETLFETFEDFIAPTEINYAIGRFPPDQRLPVDVRMDEYRGAAKRELRNETEISVEDFRDSTRVDGPGARWISLVNFASERLPISDLEAVY